MAKFDLKKAILENKATFFSSLTEGQFSWMTQDTGEQIGSQDENQIPVYMFDNKGKYYYENDYDGYGVFGGKDYYDLVAEMNGYTADNAEEFGGMFNDLRGIGIKLAFGELEPKNEGPVLFPALVTRPNEFDYKTHDFTKEAKNDPNQSWYAAEEDDEDDDYGSDNDDDYDDSRDVDDDEYGDMAEGKKEYYKDAEADDAEHIKALEKDMKDDKKSGKMKMSELKAKIKEMVLAEMESNNMEDAPENEVDFLAELEGMLSEEDGLTPLQDYVYQYEIEISGEDEAQQFLDDIKKLNTPDDVYDYYAYDRDWEGSMDDDLNNIFKQVSKKFKNLGEGLYEAEGLTPLQQYIYNYETEVSGDDFADEELENIKKLNTPDEVYDYYAEDRGWENDKDLYPELKRLYKILVKKFSNLSEAKAKDKETDTEEVTDDVTDGEETVDVTDDFSTEEPQGLGRIDVTQNANADLTGTKKEVQDNLEAALEAARTLGDEKLATQVGNTITFFNKQHVVKDTPVAEGEKMEEGKYKKGDMLQTYGGEEEVTVIDIKPNLAAALADSKNQDAVKELEKDLRQDLISREDRNKPFYLVTSKSFPVDKYYVESELESSINESMFPMLKKILK